MLMPYLAVFVACAIGFGCKWSFAHARHEPFQLFGLGGMPSTHATLVAALATAAFIETGWSWEFLIAAVFGAIVLRDAYGVRWEVTRHSDALNRLTRSKQYVRTGHRPFEVVVGALLGIAVVVVVYVLAP